MDIKKLKENPFALIGNDWMLITAGTMQKWNTMTASWGGLGVLWGKNVSYIFVRPSRYTYQFLEESETYTLSWFDSTWRDALNLCGTKSGREVDKAAATGLTPVEYAGSVSFEQARLVLSCRKLYAQDMDPALFLEADLEKNYNGSDYHRFYVGEITDCRQR